MQIDPHKQMTGLSADRMIQSARAGDFEVSLATSVILEDMLTKISSKFDGADGRVEGESVPSPLRRDQLLLRALLLVRFIHCQR